MKELRHQIVNSISEIPEEEWHHLCGHLHEGYGFYKTLEESRLHEFSFRYATVWQGGTLLAVAPLFIADFNLDIAIEGPAGETIGRIRRFLPHFFVMKTLFCGSPFGENGIIGLKPGLSETAKRYVARELVRGMNGLCRHERVSFTVFKDFLAEDISFLNNLRRWGFFRIESFPSVIMKLDFASMEEYYKTLSYAKRKDLRRKIRKAYDGAQISVEVVDSVAPLIDEVYALYLNTYHAGTIKFEKLTKEFFLAIAKNLAPHAKFFLYRVNGKLAAFNLCYVYPDLFIDKFIGFDYDISYKNNLYFVSWHYNVEWCLAHGISQFQTGQTDYDPKFALGGKPVALYAYPRHRNPFLNLSLKVLARLLRL